MSYSGLHQNWINCCFGNGFLSGKHASAWSHTSASQLGWGLGCS